MRLTAFSFLSFATFIVLLIGCGSKDNEIEKEHPIPRVGVYLEVSLDHEGAILLEPYSYKVFDAPLLSGQLLGHCGIVVTHTTQNDYAAYELACPYCWPQCIAVTMNPNRGIITAECLVCHTLYDLALGAGHPINGSGKTPLLSYRVAKAGQVLRVY